jgi:hypothetical protein
MALWDKLVAGFQSVLSLILPAFGKVRGGVKGAASGLFWVLHVVVIIVIVVGLYLLNTHVLHWDRYIPRASRFLAQGWLSVLFLMIYALCWLAWWLFKLLAPEEEMTDFPDIDEAWDEAVAALHEQGISLTDAPLFLILGQSESKENPLFQAAQLKLQVKGVPADARAPVHVFANRDGIYVTCPGTSLLAKQSKLLGGEIEPVAASGEAPPDDDPVNATLRPSTAPGGAQKIHAVLAQAVRKGRSPEQLTDAERRELRRLERKERPRPSLLKNSAEVDLQAARLNHLCRLIVRDRWPFCPVNGVLLLVPYAGTDTDQDALDTGDICQRDLMIARRTLKVHCPLFAMVCDMEGAPGFVEFVERFSEAERQQRMGQRCPLVPALRARQTAQPAPPGADESLHNMLDSMARWICFSLVPGWVYKKFRLEASGKNTATDVTPANARLFLLLDDLRDRQHRLSAILTHGLETGSENPWLLGGCYVAATGADPTHEQAFVAGVFRRLPEEQNYVSWTQEALAEEDLYQRWVSRGYVALGVMGAAVIGLALYYFGFGSKPTK